MAAMNMNNSNAMVRHEQAAIEPSNFPELLSLAKHAATSNFFGVKSPEQALMVMMRGKDLGFSYAQSLSMFHVINGKPTLTADAMVAVCRSRPDLCEYFRRVDESDASCTWETKRVGEPVQRQTFSIKDAERAGLLKNPTWTAYPARMLSARAKSFLARDVYPELLAGLYDPDELAGVALGKFHDDRTAVASHVPPSVVVTIDGEVLEEKRLDDAAQIAAAFAVQVQSAPTVKDRNRIVKLIVDAHDDGKITDAQFADLEKLARARKVELEAAP